MTTFNFSDLYNGSTSKDLQKQFIGASFQFPPNSTNLGVEWVAEEGTTILRSTYYALWAWVEATQGDQIVTDAEWLALEAASPNGAVAVYSSGDGSTTFRVPSVGTEGGFKRAKGTAVTDPVLLNIGFQDQIQNITGDAGATYSNGAAYTGAFSQGALHAYIANTAGTAAYSSLFNASNVARTGDETHPKGQYVRYFIYTGADVVGAVSTPSIEEILLATAQRPITYNNSVLGVVNQREFDGNWAGLTTGEYGYDGWLRYDVTHKAQIVEDGDYSPSTVHVVQYDGVQIETITSPASGHWLIAIPFIADSIDIRAGEVTVPFYVEEKESRLSKCYRYFETGFNAFAMCPWSTGAQIVRLQVPYKSTKRNGNYSVDLSKKAGAATAAVSEAYNDGFLAAISDNGSSNAYVTFNWVSDSTLTISDAGSNITVVG